MWSSIHGRGYTLVIVITLFYVAFSDGHHHTQMKLVGETHTTQQIQCLPHTYCPPVTVSVNQVVTPAPSGGNDNGNNGDNGNGNDNHGNNGNDNHGNNNGNANHGGGDSHDGGHRGR